MAATTARKTPANAPAKRTPAKAPEVAERTYSVEGDVLYYTTKAGFELAIDLDFPADLFKKVEESPDKATHAEEQAAQFDIVRSSFGQNFDDAWDRMGVVERRRLMTAVFSEFRKAAGIPLGESRRSSRS